MLFPLQQLALYSIIMGARTQAVQDQCPKSEYACLDVINSSQCIEQLVLEKQAPATKEALIKCVEYEGTVTTLPGATKVRFERNRRFWHAKRICADSSTIVLSMPRLPFGDHKCCNCRDVPSTVRIDI
jgi:hypothetical protein